MAVTLTPLVTEVQTRCDALTNSSTVSEIIDAAIAAKKVAMADGVVNRTVLDAQIQRIINASGSGSLIEDLIALAAANEQKSAGSGGKIIVPQRQLFTSNGAWTKPTGFIEGTLTATGIGGGAGGPRGGTSTGYSGGNAGQWVYQTPMDVSDITVGLTVPVTIGNGGAALGNGSSAVAGNSGSPTSFGAKLVLAGAIGAPTSGSDIRGASVGGALGGARSNSAEASLVVQSNNCAVGAPLNLAATPGITTPDGAPGLILDASGIKGGDSSQGLGGLGYGAGGAGSAGSGSSGATGAGAKGALLLEWWEIVE